MNNKEADQTARMRRLICVFVVRIWQNRFSHDVAHMEKGIQFNRESYVRNSDEMNQNLGYLSIKQHFFSF